MTELYFMNNSGHDQMMGFIVRSGDRTVIIENVCQPDHKRISQLEKKD